MRGCQILVLSITTLLIAACVAPERRGTNTPPVSMTITPSPKTYADLYVGFVQMGTINDWVDANTQSVKDAALDRGVKLWFVDGQDKQEIQIRVSRQFIAAHVDVIGVTPMVSSGWDAVFSEAKEAGIPIVMLNYRADVSEDLYASLVGNDYREEGRKAGHAMAEILKGNGSIVELTGSEWSYVAQDRGQGFREVLRGYPDLVLLDSQSGEWGRSDG